MPKPDLRAQLSERIRSLLGSPATVDMLDGWTEILENMAAGEPAPLVADMIAMKVVKLAIDPKKQNQWAIATILDRTEGKAGQGAPPDTSGRRFKEKMDDVTTHHLNTLAGQFIKNHAGVAIDEAREPQEAAAGPVANPLMDLPNNRARNPQDY